MLHSVEGGDLEDFDLRVRCRVFRYRFLFPFVGVGPNAPKWNTPGVELFVKLNVTAGARDFNASFRAISEANR